VKYLGFVKRTLVAALYRRAEAVVFPSLYEGFGAPPLEAMACGTPVASSLAASLGEVCRGAVHALDPYSPESIAEAMDVVVGNTAARATLREAGIRRASGFTWGHAASAHLDAYRAAARWRATE